MSKIVILLHGSGVKHSIRHVTRLMIENANTYIPEHTTCVCAIAMNINSHEIYSIRNESNDFDNIGLLHSY